MDFICNGIKEIIFLFYSKQSAFLGEKVCKFFSA